MIGVFTATRSDDGTDAVGRAIHLWRLRDGEWTVVVTHPGSDRGVAESISQT